MQPLTEAQIRESFVNASNEAIERMPLPGLHETLWQDREYIGWLDPTFAQRGYIVYWREGKPFGIVLRSATSNLSRGISAMCSLCRTHQPGSQVSLFTVAKAGQAGRDGNTIGTYICADLSCSTMIRIVPGIAPGQSSAHSPEIVAGTSPARSSEPAQNPADRQSEATALVSHRRSGLLARLDNFTRELLPAG